jgi:hypothetical protein
LVSLVLLGIIGVPFAGIGAILLLWDTPGSAFLTGADLAARLVAAAAVVGGTFFGVCAHSQAAYRRAVLITGVGLVIAIAALAPL